MSIQFKIAITKEIIERSKNCGIENEAHTIGKNCAVAIALNVIFPDVYVSGYYIFPFGNNPLKEENVKIAMPVIAQQFIKLFDGFYLTPNLRLLLPAFEFTIDVPDEVIEQIDIDEIRRVIEEGKKTVSLYTHHAVS